MKILNARQMNKVDSLTEAEFGIPTLKLMETAGGSLFGYLADNCDLESYRLPNQDKLIAIVCGKGNNGGDGAVLARWLAETSVLPDVYLIGKIEETSGNARTNLDTYLAKHATIQEITTLKKWGQVSNRFGQYGIIVDALLGTGITKPLEGLYSEVVSTINSTSAFVLSVDIPSGMFSDSLIKGPQSVRANATVTFTAPKIAHILNEDQEAIGKLQVESIGSPEQLIDKEEHYLNLLTREEIASSLPLWKTASHKGNFGHTVVVAGSRGKSGAAVLSAGAALRSGTGLVTVCVPETIQDVVASFYPEVMTEGFSATEQGTFDAPAVEPLLQFAEGKNVVAIGPGLGQCPEIVQFVHEVVHQAPVPIILDADGLNAFENKVDKLENYDNQPIILTPHLGEFGRLLGRPVVEILPKRVELARQMATEKGIWIVLKSFRTLIAQPDGQVFTMTAGNPGMATAGMGDVLTGTVASLISIYTAQGMRTPHELSKAIQLSVYLHSLAGDLAARKTGFQALTASDVMAHLGAAYQKLDQQIPR